MLTEVRIRRKLFHRNMYDVRVNGKKWWYLEKPEMFVDEHACVTPRKDMPLRVQLGVDMALNHSECFCNERWSHIMIAADGLQRMGRDVVVFSRGRKTGMIQLFPENTTVEVTNSISSANSSWRVLTLDRKRIERASARGRL